MKHNYSKLAEKYLSIAKEMAKELQMNKDVIGIAVIGSAARGDVHCLSDVDLLVLVKGTGIYRWERRLVKNTVVNVATRSSDVLKRMAKENPDTIFSLREALILYDKKSILQSLKKDATITEITRKELVNDLLDEARSFIGKAERALTEKRLESAILCLRQGAIKLADLLIFEHSGKRVNPMNLWEEIVEASLSSDFKTLFADIQGFRMVKKQWLITVLEKLKTLLPKPLE